jgi:Ca2+-binding EF-hand superfamily protein
MHSLGRDVNIEEAKVMLAQVDQNGDGQLNEKEFCDFMLAKMKEEYLSHDDNVEALRSKFMDADIDHSGVLSVDEIYAVLYSMGAELQMDELIELMNEIDVDRNGSLDIDEFVALLTMCGNEVQF